MRGNKTGGLAGQEKSEEKEQQKVAAAETKIEVKGVKKSEITEKTKEDVFKKDEKFKVNMLMLDKDIHGTRSTWMKMCVFPNMHIRRLKKNVENLYDGDTDYGKKSEYTNIRVEDMTLYVETSALGAKGHFFTELDARDKVGSCIDGKSLKADDAIQVVEKGEDPIGGIKPPSDTPLLSNGMGEVAAAIAKVDKDDKELSADQLKILIAYQLGGQQKIDVDSDVDAVAEILKSVADTFNRVVAKLHMEGVEETKEESKDEMA